jgi:hypothetical protein
MKNEKLSFLYENVKQKISDVRLVIRKETNLTPSSVLSNVEIDLIKVSLDSLLQELDLLKGRNKE